MGTCKSIGIVGCGFVAIAAARTMGFPKSLSLFVGGACREIAASLAGSTGSETDVSLTTRFRMTPARLESLAAVTRRGTVPVAPDH